jgi:ABC-type branched-subunit amino acid transport system substrate-binding protein
MKRSALALFLVLSCTLLCAFSATAADPIKIGSLVSTTGDLAAYGPPINNGGLLAAKDINAAGGVLGRDIKIILRDTQTNPTAAVDAAKKLVDIDNVVAIAGALSSGVTIPVATSVTIPSGVVQISPASTSEKITALVDNDYVFRTVAMDALQAPALAQVLSKDKGFKKISIVYVNNDYGEGLALGLKDSFEKTGGHVLSLVPYNDKQASYKGEAQKAVKGNPEAVAMVSYPQFGAMIMRQILEMGYKGTFVYADGMKAPAVAKNVGSKYVEGTYGTVAANPNQELTSWFKNHYKAEFGEMPPKPYIDTQYDAVVLMALAIAKGGKVTREAVKENLRRVANPPGEKVDARSLAKALKLIKEGKEINYDGVSGSCDFDNFGDVPGSFEVWKFAGDSIKTVKYVTVSR